MIGSLAKSTVPSGNRPDVAGEAQLGELLESAVGEAVLTRQPFELLGRERQPLEELHHLLEARRDEEVARLRRQPPEEQLEHRGIRHALLVVGLQHGELIQIGEQGARAGIAGRHLRRRRESEKSFKSYHAPSRRQATAALRRRARASTECPGAAGDLANAHISQSPASQGRATLGARSDAEFAAITPAGSRVRP